MTGTYPQSEHEKYEELCALATAGVLTPQESGALKTHLEECPSCNTLFMQYETLATLGMPSLAAEFSIAPQASTTSMDGSTALSRLIRSADLGAVHRPLLANTPDGSFWRHAGRGLIAASLLVGVAFAAYRFGEHVRGTASANLAGLPSANIAAPPPLLSAETAMERRTLEAAVTADGQRLAQLEQSLSASNAQRDALRVEAKDAEDRYQTSNASLAAAGRVSETQIATLTLDRDAAAARLRESQAAYQTVQEELTNLRSQHTQDLLHLASLDQKINGLNAALIDREKRVSSDEQYLSSDKDIRDLIGARNLYIADIMDVDESGQSKKPFGRVFYTKTKSLVFYAYDLDRQPGVKQASTFQVWGRTGPGDRKSVNLGVLYMDSATNRRWTLRVNNPQQLAELDAIFVTVEPHVQNEKPTGKPFLYASLRREANHP